MTKIRLDYIHEFRDRHGKIRRYVRLPGRNRVSLKGVPGSEEFMEAYRTALAGRYLSAWVAQGCMSAPRRSRVLGQCHCRHQRPRQLTRVAEVYRRGGPGAHGAYGHRYYGRRVPVDESIQWQTSVMGLPNWTLTHWYTTNRSKGW